ncbi:response regulator transcription factor [Paenibacillus sp. IITD108]|uniref:response regulator transcription factor n=1 Tax=Paenibacillus sp. IITD108 TaxID=3116649 RepID=UPI002F3E9630
MRILLLEDEEAIRGFIKINLKRNDMEVVEAQTGEAALHEALHNGPFDIALLDVMLPTISGFEVCEQLRELFPRMGIIMLTAKSQEEDKIYGLELGADDYVQKPFSPGELIARIKSLRRRMMADMDHSYKQKQLEQENESEKQDKQSAAAYAADELISGAFRLSMLERRLWKDNQEIILTPTEWSLVKLLMEREGESISRDFILTEVWGRYYVGDLKVVDVNIRRIRQKLERDPSAPTIIETVWGFGYRWQRSESQ